MPNELIKIRLKKHMAGVGKPGDEIAVEVRKGYPVDRFWRNRLIDAKTDDCCEIVQKPKTGRPRRVAIDERHSED